VDQPEPAEAAAPGAQAANFRKIDTRGVAHEDVLDLAAAVDQDADLTLDLARDAPQEAGQLGRGDLRGLEPPPVDALQRMFLARLEPGDIAGDGFQEAEVSTVRLDLRARVEASCLYRPSMSQFVKAVAAGRP
jgi:hypothetical protein